LRAGLYLAAYGEAGKWILWSVDSWGSRGGPWDSIEEAEAALAAMGWEPDPDWRPFAGRKYVKVRPTGGWS